MVGSASAQEKITFQDHILPLVEANCAKCHNSDKKKGDLDLTSYSAALSGGASGKVLLAGDPEASRLWKSINHLEDPSMPPNRSKMTDKELAVFRKWIAGGLLETSGSKAITGKPTVDLALGASAIGKPDGPPPMPGDLLLEPVLPVKRATAQTGLAASPWAPVVAVAGQKQIALYHSDTFELLGVIPFRDGTESYQPEDLKFSRNGKLLCVGGGHAAKAGRVLVFDITTGERIISVGAGQEFDSALGSDLSPDQSQIALGGPSRLVKIFSTKDGSLLFKLKKHTDWVTAIAFSPNGEWLASADRNGGISIWDGDNGQEIHTLAGHKSAVTALSWRSDSKVLASVSEDGSAKIWEMNEGKQAKTWNPHPSGALSISYARDGRVVTCGRDNQVITWSADGTKLKSFECTNELPVRVTFSHDGARVIAADWTGQVTVWNTTDGKRLGQLAANPPSIAEQLAITQQRLTALQGGQARPSAEQLAAENTLTALLGDWQQASNNLAKARADLAPKETAAAALKAEVAKNSTPELVAKHQSARESRNQARLALTNALATLQSKNAQLHQASAQAVGIKRMDPEEELSSLKTQLVKLQAAQVYATVYYAKESIAAKKREQEKLLASSTKSDQAAAEKLAKQISKEEQVLLKLTGDYQKLKSTSLSPAPTAQESKL